MQRIPEVTKIDPKAQERDKFSPNKKPPIPVKRKLNPVIETVTVAVVGDLSIVFAVVLVIAALQRSIPANAIPLKR